MNKISKYFRGVAEEARRVRWPDQKTLWKAVAVVLVIATVAALRGCLSLQEQSSKNPVGCQRESTTVRFV